MRRSKQNTQSPTRMVRPAYDDHRQRGQPGWQPQQQWYQDQQGSSQYQNRSSWQRGQQSGTMQMRNTQLERQAASQLRPGGLGQDSQIMILATGDRVILPGIVPDQDQRQQAELTTNQVCGVQQVDNRLQVNRGTARLSDSQLKQRIEQQVQAQPEESAIRSRRCLRSTLEYDRGCVEGRRRSVPRSRNATALRVP